MSFNVKLIENKCNNDYSFNPLKSGQCLSMLYSNHRAGIDGMNVSIPLNRVNVFQYIRDNVNNQVKEMVSIPLNRVNVFQCYWKEWPFWKIKCVSIPLNRVNVFQLDMLDLVDLDIPEGFNPLKSGQCLSIKGSKEFFEKSNVSIPLNRVNVF